jgi:hypothetical protein
MDPSGTWGHQRPSGAGHRGGTTPVDGADSSTSPPRPGRPGRRPSHPRERAVPTTRRS